MTLLQGAQAALVALALPLFPLHGVYVAALLRAPGYFPVALAVALPAAGLYGLADLTRSLPPESLRAVSALALVGALYGSLKALAQFEINRLLAYAGVVFYSVLWWNIAMAAKFAVPTAVYVAAASLLSAGLLLAWQRLRRRYGDLKLDRAHGLARPMPRFAVVLSLLIMAAVGLPPFGLFFGQVELLLRPGLAFSWELGAMLLSWFLVSWYLFRMMQRLLFGPHRSDLRYEDLRANEVAYFVVLLVLLIFLGATPPALLQSGLLPDGRHAAMEILLWLK
jgi:NADH-quinone oxidoreductase subunit M